MRGAISVMIVPTATVITVVNSNYTDRDFLLQLESENKMRQRRILSSTLGSDSFGKFSTLLDSSTAYKNGDSHRHDPFCRVLNMELLQFYYSASSGKRPR